MNSHFLFAQSVLADKDKNADHREQKERTDEQTHNKTQAATELLDQTVVLCVGEKTFHCFLLPALTVSRREAHRGYAIPPECLDPSSTMNICLPISIKTPYPGSF